MPTIKMKKGYPTSDGVMHDKHVDGVMHDKHVDAVKAQVLINMVKAVDAAAAASESGVIDIRKFVEGMPVVVGDYIKYFCTKPKPKTAAPKKKTAKK